MRSKSDYKRAVRVVREVVHAWDPYRLIAGGAPDDEFDHEIASVVAQIPRIRSARDASHALSRVFSSSFGPERFGPEHCSEVGERLYVRLQQEGLCPSRGME